LQVGKQVKLNCDLCPANQIVPCYFCATNHQMTRVARPHKRTFLEASPFQSRPLSTANQTAGTAAGKRRIVDNRNSRRPIQKQPAICYCCGSAEHSLNQCKKYTKGQQQQQLPFAHCFVCKQQGHLASACEQNEHGIYRHGGACKRCGSVRHLLRDCPVAADEAKDEWDNKRRHGDNFTDDDEGRGGAGVRLGKMNLKQSADDDDALIAIYSQSGEQQSRKPAKAAPPSKKKVVIFR
jgi:hypothetical protein